jgi:hypothetical protein
VDLSACFTLFFTCSTEGETQIRFLNNSSFKKQKILLSIETREPYKPTINHHYYGLTQFACIKHMII